MKPTTRTALIITWIALLAWGAGLLFWWQQQNSRLNQDTPAPVTALEAPQVAGPGEPEPGSIQAPGVQTPSPAGTDARTLSLASRPLERDPGPAALAEDYVAMASAFDVTSALADIEQLAAPPFDGRRAGTQSGQAAAAYVADAFARFDLQPAGEVQANGSRSYFQDFPLGFFVAYAAPPVLEVFGPDGEAAAPYDFRLDYSSYVRDYAGQGEAEGPVVWANYCTHDDFDAVDAVEAIVLCRLGGEEDATRNALEHGAAGLLLIGEPEERPIDRIGRYGVPLVPEPLPTFVVDPRVVEDLLEGSGYTLDDLTVQFQGLPLATHARLQVELEQRENAMGRNVLGVIPGSDPDVAHEVVMVGAHYDHLGRDPDGLVCTRLAQDEPERCRQVEGAVYWGANDNASGTATLLEIARLWQETGYLPRRTVVFAAWDAEEQGLWGSTHYVQNPTAPLTSTVAYLNLDMVGAGSDVLAVDGPGPVADQLIALAPSVGISTTLEDGGRSDHVPFRTAGVDASMIIWFADYDASNPGLAHYHRPLDQPEVIDPSKLERAGELASLTLFTLASVTPELESLVQQRSAAINQGDRDAFLATSSPSRRKSEESWWDALMSSTPQQVSITLVNPIVVGDVATATLRYAVQTEDSDLVRRVEDVVRLSRTQDSAASRSADGTGGWRLQGPALSSLAGAPLTLYFPARDAAQAPEVLAAAVERYEAIYRRLTGRAGAPAGQLFLHPSTERLQAAAGLTLPQNAAMWASDSAVHLTSQANITRTDTLTTALTQLTLAQAGLREETVPWLWQGLPQHLGSDASRQDQAVTYLGSLDGLLSTRVPFSVADFPSLRDQAGGTSAWQAAAWAATGHLLETYGEAGLSRLLDELASIAPGSPAAVEAALQRALGVSAEQFDAGWQESWRSRIERAQQQIDELLEQRQSAALAGDQAAFLGLVDPADPALLEEEAAWLEHVRAQPLASYDLQGKLAGLSTDGVLAEIQASWLAQESDQERPQRVTFMAWLPERDGRLRYGGARWFAQGGDKVTIRHRATNARLAEALLPQAESAYQTIAAALGIDPQPVQVKLYDNGLELQLATNPNRPTSAPADMAGSRSIRTLVGPGEGPEAVREVRNGLTDGIVASLLRQAGVPAGEETRWLRNGLGRLALEWIDPTSGWQQAARLSGRIPLATQRGDFWPLDELPDETTLSAGDRSLAQAQSLDAVRYLIATYGEARLHELIQSLAQGQGQDTALQAALGTSLQAFEASWLASAAILHVPPDWITLADSSDGEAALARAQALAGDPYGGREVGTPQGEQAAQEIASAFRSLGLQPAGPGTSYLQTFVFSQALPAAPPSLVVRHDDQELSLAYREDFVELTEGHGLGGSVDGPLVWIRDPAYAGMQLDGKVVLREPSEPLAEELAAAAEAGAGALILVTNVGRNELTSRSPIDLSSVVTPTMPVLQLSKPAFEALLDLGGLTLRDLNTAPAALPLDMEAQVAVPLEDPSPAQGANVLGLWPGTDPELADQVVVLGAHYDGPGRDGAGTSYPAANDNGSGVAVLLEVARAWQATGVQPARSVLFAAWDGEELGQRGARTYLAEPAMPLTQTVGMLNLDNVGAGQGFFVTYEGDRSREALLNWAISTASQVLNVRADLVIPEEDGDHTAFQEAGVPATLLSWSGATDDANTSRDEPANLDAVKLRQTGRLVTLALRWLAQ